MTTYRVRIGDRETRVRVRPDSVIRDEDSFAIVAEDYNGGHHNYGGVRGFAVERAVEKLFGRRAFWFGGYNDVSHGQVFEALRPTKLNGNPGNTALTPTVRLDVEEVGR
jgi:hypothetical protein